MKVALGADHGGFRLKQALAEHLKALGHEVLDLGVHSSEEPSDYPDIALAVGRALQEGRAQRGILVCGSGVGASVAANKLRGIRAAVCHDTFSARQGVEDDDMNILCLGQRVVGTELAKEVVRVFLEARFSEEERHRRRLRKVLALERRT
jgi:ribose 5-phosphate isomerase B